MFSRFFIDRPIFAAVISIVIVLAGLVTFNALPVSMYPEITPPTVQVSATYPGAGAPRWPTPSPAPSKRRSTGWKECSTCRAFAPATANMA